MTTQATTTASYDELCVGCGQVDGVYWVDSTPDADCWACRHCGAEWTITVDVPGR